MAVTQKNHVVTLTANNDTVASSTFFSVTKVTFRETGNTEAEATLQVDSDNTSFISCTLTAKELKQFDFSVPIPVNGLKLVVTSGTVEVRVYFV